MNVQKLHNSHSNLKGCLFLYRLFCNHSSFRWIREETDFSNHSRSIIIPKKIIVGICFNFPVVFYSCKAVHLCLYQTGETFAFGVIWVIEYLGSAGRRIREAVLMYTYCTVYFTFFDKCFSFFLDHWIFYWRNCHLRGFGLHSGSE